MTRSWLVSCGLAAALLAGCQKTPDDPAPAPLSGGPMAPTIRPTEPTSAAMVFEERMATAGSAAMAGSGGNPHRRPRPPMGRPDCPARSRFRPRNRARRAAGTNVAPTTRDPAVTGRHGC